MVKSENIKNLSSVELDLLVQEVENLGKAALKKFRQSFNPDEMGFAERAEGVEA